jgi:hypothetical protein
LSDQEFDPLAELDGLLKEREKELNLTSLRDADFLRQVCSRCGKEMTVGKGVTLYGGRWYHRGCWASSKASIRAPKVG